MPHAMASWPPAALSRTAGIGHDVVNADNYEFGFI
jgi:hypothetical protein